MRELVTIANPKEGMTKKIIETSDPALVEQIAEALNALRDIPLTSGTVFTDRHGFTSFEAHRKDAIEGEVKTYHDTEGRTRITSSHQQVTVFHAARRARIIVEKR